MDSLQFHSLFKHYHSVGTQSDQIVQCDWSDGGYVRFQCSEWASGNIHKESYFCCCPNDLHNKLFDIFWRDSPLLQTFFVDENNLMEMYGWSKTDFFECDFARNH